MKKGNNAEAANLRQKAEELLKKKSLKTDSQLSETDILSLNHELQVHQIELEMQNEELSLANEQAEVAAQKYTKLYNFAPSGYFILSKEGKVIDLNLSGTNMLGKKFSRLKNNQFGFFVSNDTKLIFTLFLSKVFNSKAEESCEITLSTDGNLPMYVYLNGIVTENGEQCLVNVMNITDRKRSEELNIANKELVFQITERKQAEEALKKSEERFRTLFENSTVGIYRTTPDGQILLANPTLIKLLGYTSFEELAGRNLVEDGFEPSYERTYFIDIMKREGEVKGLESAWTRMDGTTLFISESARAINDNEGKIIYYDGIVEDITLRKKAERELIIANKELTFQNEEKEKRATELIIANKELVFQNEEKEKRATELTIAKEQAEESDRLKSTFLANMSHEIRTPMNGILGFAELLKEPNLTVEEQQDFIRTIGISGMRMLNTINNIVDISKIESGLMKVDIKETNINEKIEFTYKFFKPEVEIKGLQFLFKNSLPAKKAIIKTDNEKVYGMLANLIKNAIKFTYEGSIEFGYEKKGGYLEFFVKDTGIGIPQNQHKLIFERFRQGSESHNRGYEGSGLGLSIAKSYVEMLGGEIWVESEEGKGSIFYFTIPYNAVSEEKIEIVNVVSAEHKEVEIKNLKILIVEDDEISYSFLTKTLQKISYEVLHAITGVQAVEACRNNPDLDLVLMDIRMPKMDGNEATRQIRQFNTDVIIIAQTAYAFSDDREKAIEAGCNDYISKPINMTLLIGLILKHFNK